MDDIERRLEERYRRSFGRIAGYLPKDRASVDEWHKKLKPQVAKAAAAIDSPAVRALAHLIGSDGIIRMYVTEMMEQVPPPHNQIQTIAELLAALDQI